MAHLIFPLAVFGFILIIFAKHSFRYSYTVVIQFAIGAIIIELAWFHALVNIIFMFMAIGDANNWGINTVLGFALCAYNAFQLWIIHTESLEAKAIIGSALTKPYGENPLDMILPERRHFIKKGVSKHQWLKPFRLKQKGMKTFKNITYGQHKSNTLTIYTPENIGETPMPVMLQIHGGGWIIGYSDKQALPFRNKLISANWIFVAIDYRLSPSAKFPDHLVDCKQALLWIKDNISEYGGDPDFIMATGGSAGAHLASLLALTHNKETERCQPGFSDVELPEIRACIPMYGVYDFTDSNNYRCKVPIIPFLESTVMPTSLENDASLWQLASPIHQLDENRPPFLIMHGELDTLAFIEEAKVFANKASDTSSQACIFIEIPMAQHAFDLFYSPHCIESIKTMHIFAEIQYSLYLKNDG